MSEINKLSRLEGEYNAAFKQLALIENELTKELQKYVSWDTIQVSIDGGGTPLVKAKGEIDAVPLNDFINHVNEQGIMFHIAYEYLAYI